MILTSYDQSKLLTEPKSISLSEPEPYIERLAWS